MKRILIIGAGTAGTMMAVHLSRKLNRNHHPSVRLCVPEQRHRIQM